MRALSFIRAVLAGIALCLLPACSTPGPQDAARVGPFFVPTNYRSTAAIHGVRRVVVMPMHVGDVATPETGSTLDPIFVEALRRQNLFDVVTVSRAECRRRFGVASLSCDAVLPRALLTSLRTDHGADAVLLVDLTAYSPYRPLTVGVRAMLVGGSPGTAQVLWAFDEVFSAGNPKVANSARHYFLDRRGGEIPADLTRFALVSPSRFSAYVAAAVFGTLPPVAPVAGGPRVPALKLGRVPSIAAVEPNTR